MKAIINLEATARTVLTEEAFDFFNANGINWDYHSPFGSNTKLSKGEVKTLGFAMLPHQALNIYLREPVNTVCALAEQSGCIKGCLGTDSGHYSMKRGNAHFKLVKASLCFHFHRFELDEMVSNAVDTLRAKAKKDKGQYHVRLNVFSDIDYTKYFSSDEYIRFYDYTKVLTPTKVRRALEQGYELAYSVTPALKDSHLLKKQLAMALKHLSFTAWVVPADIQQNVIRRLNEWQNTMREVGNKDWRYLACDGDKFDHFATRKDQSGSIFDHYFLILKGKASKKDVRESLDVQWLNEEDEIVNVLCEAYLNKEKF